MMIVGLLWLSLVDVFCLRCPGDNDDDVLPSSWWLTSDHETWNEVDWTPDVSNWHSTDSYEVLLFPRFRFTSLLGVRWERDSWWSSVSCVVIASSYQGCSRIDSRTLWTVCTRESPIAVLESLQRCCDIITWTWPLLSLIFFFVIPDQAAEIWAEIPRRLLLVCPS